MNAPMNELFNLADLVNAAAGQVANRTLAKNDTTTACLMALAPGENIATHSAPCDALVVALEGECTFTVGDKTHQVKAGQALQMPGGVPHALHSTEGFKMMLLLVR